MNRRSFPNGQTSTALLKSVLMAFEARGIHEAEAWLKSINLRRDDLDDETRMVPVTTLQQGLKAYATATSKDAIIDLWRFLVTPDNLGIWVRVLRGTTTPAEAFARLDSSDSQYGRTTRWETMDARPGYWKGRVYIAHDPSIEEDGLLQFARIAEVTAVPQLFGFSNAKARVTTSKPGMQEFEVQWPVPRVRRSSMVGGLFGVPVMGALLAVPAVSLQLALVISAFASLAASLLGAARAREQLRRTESIAQTTRVHALERSLMLKETREQNAAGELEGSVAAGQYRIKQRMGSGASGVIYEAERMSDGLPVAIKLLRAAAAHDAVASDRLRREAEALGLAWHPNVVEVIDHGHLPDGTAYLVMELLQGESLATRLRRKQQLSLAELLPIAIQACDALAAVHAAGIVHRDIKPGNVFLARDLTDPNGPDTVKLLDFGIARVEWEETRITNAGGPLGTPGYMSPEQELGTEVDARSDIFSLGALIYECLVGEPPPPRTPSGFVRTGENPSIFRVESGVQKTAQLVPPAWQIVLEKAMAALPQDRYPDIRSFAIVLRELAGQSGRAELAEASNK